MDALINEQAIYEPVVKSDSTHGVHEPSCKLDGETVRPTIFCLKVTVLSLAHCGSSGDMRFTSTFNNCWHSFSNSTRSEFRTIHRLTIILLHNIFPFPSTNSARGRIRRCWTPVWRALNSAHTTSVLRPDRIRGMVSWRSHTITKLWPRSIF